jgi:hypothetical protein
MASLNCYTETKGHWEWLANCSLDGHVAACQPILATRTDQKAVILESVAAELDPDAALTLDMADSNFISEIAVTT